MIWECRGGVMIKNIKLTKKAGLYLVMLILALIFTFPFVIMFFTAFKSQAELQQPYFTLMPKSFTPENFIGAMATGNWPRYFYNSAFITVITVILSLFLNSMAAYSFSRLEFPGRNALFMFSLIALMIPEQVIMIPVFLRLKTIPFLGGNNWLGIGGTGLLNSYAGLVVPFVAHPFGVFLCRQSFMTFPKSLDEAAILDGCSRFRIFWNMYLPLSKPVLVTLGLLKAVTTWNQYTWPLILTNSDGMRTVQLALSNFSTEFTTNWGYVMAATTLIILPVMILFLCLQKYYVSGIVASGIKG